MPFDPHRLSLALLARSVIPCLMLLTPSATSICAQKSENSSAGIAWQVRGSWQVGGKGAPILTGDAIEAGSLLQPGAETVNHSITVLLPDGQRVQYECFSMEDCSRGFRVPSLYRAPAPFAVDMLARIRKTLGANDGGILVGATIQQATRLPRDEAVAVLDPGNRVHVEGLAARMSNGRYVYDVRPLDRAHPREFHLPIEKSGPSITLALPSSGLYFLTITDSLSTPRIDLFIAAVEPARAGDVEKSYRDAAALMKGWNEYYQGWPIHDFQRAYLESLMLSPNGLPDASRTDAIGKSDDRMGQAGRRSDAPDDRAGVTAEPEFVPKPGLLDANTEVTLRCSSPDAVIHFTVDGSDPASSSPVYRAPIMVRGTELTIKSFAGVSGKKDSAVVTGIFRVQE